MILFTADQHYNHNRIRNYCQRPFASVQEMNQTLIDNHNSVVKQEDTIYMLGDFGFGNLEPILKRLNGKKVLLVGSHDKDTLKYKQYFDNIQHMITLKEKWGTITLCHYALRTWPKSHYNSWHIFGHSHGTLTPMGKSFDVGVDSHLFLPWSLAGIIQRMKVLPDNPGLVHK